jgi:hypothetical protein
MNRKCIRSNLNARFACTIFVLALASTSMLDMSAKAQQKPPMVLQGRIEQISGQGEPKLPAFKAMTGKLDPRAQQAGKKQDGSASAVGKASKSSQPEASYPVNWEGDWRGQLRIMSARYVDPSPPQLRDEFAREKLINTPGKMGSSVFRFRRQPPNTVSLDPVNIEFSLPDTMQKMEPIAITRENASRFLKPGQTFEEGMKLFPTRTYFIAMNNVQSGITFGGNFVTQRVMRNNVKSLAPKVVEQDIVTYSVEELREARQNYASYNEDVLRFTMINQRTILVQAITLSYNARGKCDAQLSLAGYIYR